MPSEHRLHPASILFNLAGQAKELLVPGLIVIFTARRGDAWQIWGMFLLIPYVVVAISRYLTFRYRYEEHELAMRWGLVFRKERHVPYGRIQNLDAVQNPFHRLFGVATVRLETGGGDEPEARMSVLPLDAFDEMRRRVFEGRAAAAAAPVEGLAAEAPPAVRGVTLLQLEPRALMVAGLIENRGMVLIAAALGVIWEAGLGDGLMDRILGEQSPGRGPLRRVFAALVGRAAMPWREVAVMAGVFIGALLVIRLLSMIWGLIRLSGFTLTRTGEDLRSTYGLFTRVTATIPMRRIQTLTIVEGPWHQLFGWAAVRVTTAGGGARGRGQQGGTAEREWLAPIIRRDALAAFLRDVLPEVRVDELGWARVHPRVRPRAPRLARRRGPRLRDARDGPRMVGDRDVRGVARVVGDRGAPVRPLRGVVVGRAGGRVPHGLAVAAHDHRARDAHSGREPDGVAIRSPHRYGERERRHRRQRLGVPRAHSVSAARCRGVAVLVALSAGSTH
jgi:putative membrane protein